MSRLLTMFALAITLACTTQVRASEPLKSIFLGEQTVDLKLCKYRCGMWLVIYEDRVKLEGWEFVRVSGQKVYEDKSHSFLTLNYPNKEIVYDYPVGPGKITVRGKITIGDALYVSASMRFGVGGQEATVVSVQQKVNLGGLGFSLPGQESSGPSLPPSAPQFVPDVFMVVLRNETGRVINVAAKFQDPATGQWLDRYMLNLNPGAAYNAGYTKNKFVYLFSQGFDAQGKIIYEVGGHDAPFNAPFGNFGMRKGNFTILGNTLLFVFK